MGKCATGQPALLGAVSAISITVLGKGGMLMHSVCKYGFCEDGFGIELDRIR